VEGAEGEVRGTAEHAAAAPVGVREGTAGRSGRGYLARNKWLRGFHEGLLREV
jgi:hypothetical protein